MKNIESKVRERFRKRSFSLNGLDLKLTHHIKIRRGFFIEAGANDGLKQSNSLYFEKYMGWKGLLIEPIPDLAEQCRLNRPRCLVENCALVSAGYKERTVEMQYNDLMSFVKGAFGDEADESQFIETGKKFLRPGDSPHLISVPAKTLSDVLDSHRIEHVDLLSLDVEGYEADVLGGLDFGRHAPHFILCEVRHNKKQAIESILAPYYNEPSILNTNESYSDVLYRLK